MFFVALPAAIVLLAAVIIGASHALLPMLLRPGGHIHHRLILQITPHSGPRTPSLFAITSIDEQDDTISPTWSNINSNDCRNDKIIEELGGAFSHKLSELEEYQRENGDCLVPKRYKNNPSLGNWVNKQRQNYRKFMDGERTSMNEERISALNRIGFVWNASTRPISSHYDMTWKNMYSQLAKFCAANGHCQVPSSSSLGQWVVRQRFLYRKSPSGEAKSSLTNERINLLNDLKFPWTTRSEQLWEQRMKELLRFKQQNGHCMVPRCYAPNPRLSAWVATQRKNYNRRQSGKLSPLTMGRIKELEEMGFVWSYWDHNFMAGGHAD